MGNDLSDSTNPNSAIFDENKLDLKASDSLDCCCKRKSTCFGEKKAHHERAPYSLILKTSHEVLLFSINRT